VCFASLKEQNFNMLYKSVWSYDQPSNYVGLKPLFNLSPSFLRFLLLEQHQAGWNRWQLWVSKMASLISLLFTVGLNWVPWTCQSINMGSCQVNVHLEMMIIFTMNHLISCLVKQKLEQWAAFTQRNLNDIENVF
jgi:hypothetical protein